MNNTVKIIEDEKNVQLLTSTADAITWPLSKEDQHAIDLLQLMHQQCQGVGLAAPQIGISKQIFIIEITDSQAELREQGQPFAREIYCNPSYKPIDNNDLQHDLEACFSVRDTAGWVPRYQRIQFCAQNTQGKAVKFEAQGFTARVLQHETDHCHGILITHRLDDTCIQGSPEAMYARRRDMLSEQQRLKHDQLRNMQKSSDKT